MAPAWLPKWRQDGPRWPKMSQDDAKIDPRWAKIAQHGANMAPRWAKIESK